MRASWLEDDQVFEGVGAHRLNPRYDPVDEEDPEVQPATKQFMRLMTPQMKVNSLMSTSVGLQIRLDMHDGAHYQYDAGPINFEALAAAVWCLGWKTSQSIHYKDYTYDRVAAEHARFEMFFGYHWLSSTTDPEQQAAWYIQCQGDDLPPLMGGMGDFEESGITVDGCLGFLEYWEAKRKRPMVGYTGIYVSGGSIWNDERMWEGKYGVRPFIVAAYVTEANLRARLALQHRKNFDGWQYGSGGPVPGIVGRADKDRVDNKPLFATALTPTPTPTPIPPPTTGADMSVLAVPTRVWDSRPGSAQGGNGKHATGETFLIDINKTLPIPADAKGVIVNITVIDAEGDGYLAAWGAGARPGVSNVNYRYGEVKANCAVVPISGAGINVFTSKACNVIVDVQGWTA